MDNGKTVASVLADTMMGAMADMETRLARMEATLDALRADVASLRETPRVEAPKRTAPDALAVLCERIAEVARKRRRWPTTTYEVRELLSLGDVSGNTIDGAFKRIANGAVAGVKAERFGETNIPSHGAAALWIFTAE